MIEQELRGALAAALDGLPARRASGAVERLIAHYRGETPTGAPVLRDAADAAAYAAYRMPATFAAASAALAELADRAGDWTPGSHLDVGGGTGAAVWAAERVWPTERAARATVVVDWAEPALALGRGLASGVAALRGAEWRRGSLRGGGGTAGGGLPEPAAADLVTVSYVLGELAEADRHAVVDAAARAARGAVVLVEPGTPEGYLRIRAARDALLGAGLRVLAPCPHDGACPLVPGQDWCHFAVRGRPLLAAPPGEGRGAAVRGREVQLCGGGAGDGAGCPPRAPGSSAGRSFARDRCCWTCARTAAPCTAVPSPSGRAPTTARPARPPGATRGDRAARFRGPGPLSRPGAGQDRSSAVTHLTLPPPFSSSVRSTGTGS